jgi:hypothetical protein
MKGSARDVAPRDLGKAHAGIPPGLAYAFWPYVDAAPPSPDGCHDQESICLGVHFSPSDLTERGWTGTSRPTVRSPQQQDGKFA